MGNCSQKCISPCSSDDRACQIRVWTQTGQLVEFAGPMIAREILGNFPGGYGIFAGGEMNLPLQQEEQLQNGRVYYALPLWKAGNSDFRRARGENSMSPAMESLPTQRNGVWRVKLAISVEELEEMLAGQVNVESLIHKMRMGQGFNVKN